MHFLDHKIYWKGWPEEKIRRVYAAVKFVPVIEQAFEKVMRYVKEKGYLDQ
jgi:hypothetical protein